MQLFKSFVLVTAAVSTALAFDSGIEAGIKGHGHPSPPERSLGRRGPIHQVISILQSKKKVGSDFCSTFLHLPPYAATRTVTTTRTLTKDVPLSTTTVQKVLTSIGAPFIVVDTTAVIVPVTPTVDVTVASAVPSTSVVATVTSVLTQTTTVATDVVTQLTTVTATTTVVPRNAPGPHDPSRTRLPYWLDQWTCPEVSKACSEIVTPKTTTVTKTAAAAATVTVKSGVVSIGSTSTKVVVPTQTSIQTVTSTSTAAAVTSTVIVASSSLFPVTATVASTALVSVTATVTTVLTVAVPPPSASPSARIKLNKASDDSFFGYIGSETSDGYFVPVTDASDALIIQFPSDYFINGGPVNFVIPGSKHPNLGASVGSASTSNDLDENSANYVYLTSTDTVPPRTQKTDTTGTGFDFTGYDETYESQIWDIDPFTNQLSIDWYNSDGTSIYDAALFYESSEFLAWTGNFNDYQSRFSGTDLTELTPYLEVIT